MDEEQFNKYIRSKHGIKKGKLNDEEYDYLIECEKGWHVPYEYEKSLDAIKTGLLCAQCRYIYQLQESLDQEFGGGIDYNEMAEYCRYGCVYNQNYEWKNMKEIYIYKPTKEELIRGIRRMERRKFNSGEMH